MYQLSIKGCRCHSFCYKMFDRWTQYTTYHKVSESLEQSKTLEKMGPEIPEVLLKKKCNIFYNFFSINL